MVEPGLETKSPNSTPATTGGDSGHGRSDDDVTSSSDDNGELMAQLEAMQVALRQQEARLRDQERKMKEQEETHLSQEKKLKARMDEERKALKRREEEKAKEMLRLEQEKLAELKRKEEELLREETERRRQLDLERQKLVVKEQELNEKEEMLSVRSMRSESEDLDIEDGKDRAPSTSSRRSSVPDSAGTDPCNCMQTGFEECVVPEGHTCKCSFACEFVVVEYFADSKSMTDQLLGDVNSSWMARRKKEEEEKQQREEEDRQRNKEIWERVKREMEAEDAGN